MTKKFTDTPTVFSIEDIDEMTNMSKNFSYKDHMICRECGAVSIETDKICFDCTWRRGKNGKEKD